jgi:hypothetical protein
MWQAVLASGIVGFLFLVAITVLAGDPVALAESATPMADVINRVLGPVVGDALLVMVVVAIFACRHGHHDEQRPPGLGHVPG